MQQLIHGLHQFRDKVVGREPAFYQGLARGQAPETLFITCSDSRIIPHQLTQTGPGELFIMRNAGNIVPPYGAMDGGEAASIEYAITVLKVSHIVICGHSHCGAMAALSTDTDMSDLPAMAKWLRFAARARRAVHDNYTHLVGQARVLAAVQENVLVQLDNLRTHPSVARACKAGALTLHGWVYKIETGLVRAHDAESGDFLPLNAKVPQPCDTRARAGEIGG